MILNKRTALTRQAMNMIFLDPLGKPKVKADRNN